MSSQNTKAFVSILLASFLFGFMAFLVKILSANLSAAEILFIRAVIGIIFILFMILFGFKALRMQNRRMLMIRGLFGGLAVFLYFSSISRIPLSSAALLANSYPLFAALFSTIIIREKTSFSSLLAMLVAFAGLFLVLDPHRVRPDAGYLLALTSAVFAGVAVTSIRELRKTDSSWVIVFAQMLGAALFCFMPMTAAFRLPRISEWGILVLIGAAGTAGQIYLTRPFKYVSASEGSIAALATSVFAILFSVVFLREILTLQFIAGALLVFGSSFYLIAREEGWVKI